MKKGWELYVWEENDEIYYSLILGTNRLKTEAEIIRVSVKGIDAIKPKLDKLRSGQTITIWGNRFSITPSNDIEVQEYCKKIGLVIQ